MMSESRDFAAENTFDGQVDLVVTIRGWMVSDTPGFTESDARANALSEITEILSEHGYTIGSMF